MSFVYQLSARGTDCLTRGKSLRTVQTRTVYATPEIAQSRIEKFRQLLIKQERMLSPANGGDEIVITIQQLEVIDDRDDNKL